MSNAPRLSVAPQGPQALLNPTCRDIFLKYPLDAPPSSPPGREAPSVMGWGPGVGQEARRLSLYSVSRLVPSVPHVAWAGLSHQQPWGGGGSSTRTSEDGMQFWFERQPHVSICHNLAFKQEVTACLSPSCNLAVFTKALKCESCGHIHKDTSLKSRTRVCCSVLPSC